MELIATAFFGTLALLVSSGLRLTSGVVGSAHVPFVLKLKFLFAGF